MGAAVHVFQIMIYRLQGDKECETDSVPQFSIAQTGAIPLSSQDFTRS